MYIQKLPISVADVVETRYQSQTHRIVPNKNKFPQRQFGFNLLEAMREYLLTFPRIHPRRRF